MKAGQPTLTQLKYFAALADMGHYRKAADLVGISQPSLSLQLSKLEKTLSLQLVERGRTGAILTPGGREVLKIARRILQDVEELETTSAQISRGLEGTLRLGSSPTLGPYLLPNVLQKLHAEYPSLRLRIRDGAPSDLLSELLAGGHDLILTQLPVASSDVHVMRLFREPLRLAVARDHPLAALSRATDDDLLGETLLTLSSRFTLHSQIRQLAVEVGANVLDEYEGTSLDALRQMTSMNLGVTFLPALYVSSEVTRKNEDVKILSFRDAKFTRSIGLVWRKSSPNQAALKVFTETLVTVGKERFQGLLSWET